MEMGLRQTGKEAEAGVRAALQGDPLPEPLSFEISHKQRQTRSYRIASWGTPLKDSGGGVLATRHPRLFIRPETSISIYMARETATGFQYGLEVPGDGEDTSSAA